MRLWEQREEWYTFRFRDEVLHTGPVECFAQGVLMVARIEDVRNA